MKITKKDFEQMQKKYDQEIRKGKPARGPQRDVDNQTNWIFFDRETIEEVLSKADQDPKKGGIKFYFTEYTEEVARKLYPENPEDYIGRLGIVMSPCNSANEKVDDEEEEYYNRGDFCPPKCE
ncbi:molecular chaperone DnaK [Algoriphagus limi]|uniref:Molecular chaperone DnaK n=1 Tax=Algoriphagus limi TaxID=2975273 RepID=A0ABT2G6D1_9BACT|nr:molecular chaperone DnaK [Algoriphagus limi]MCS5490818.1 molecular chaperone DnaK [Algoriphagus limi]